ncbi:S41 family peptidase [Cytophagaceae bacterium DM2B3-1]|uniref:S41 family peptidase n=1 Tax=Xanthocytophaga flava TaxID=3048013 RepID=A0ABT7CJA9_9BACT|nr:S41 family peptidase [Xanthocytophaga flavus]
MKKQSLKVQCLYTIFFLLLLSLGFVSCKKDSEAVTPDTVDVRDSAYYYSLVYYLWNEKLPDYAKWSATNGDLIRSSETTFKPQSFANVDSIMSGSAGIRSYSDVGTSGKHLDRYSFAYTQTDWENTSSGSNAGFGFRRGYLSSTDQRVVYVYKNSPIGLAGVQRGWQILSVNGVEATAANEEAFYNSLNSNSTSTFVFKTNEGIQKTLTLTKASYKANFVQKDTVISAGGLKIGYIALSSFLGDNDGADTEAELDAAITDLKSTGITDLVIDLRYNGGGYTSVSEYFANLVAPASAKGKAMYSYKYNALLTSEFKKAGYTTDINFDTKSANFNLTRIVFITSEETASASELLINNLKPYLNVTLVGSTTYGKPVGFPGILIEMSKTDVTQNYYVFPIAFKTVNANNESDYFDGMTANISSTDDYSKDWGNPNEACFNAAISYLTGGSSTRQSARISSEKLKQLNLNTKNEKLGGINEMITTDKIPVLPFK